MGRLESLTAWALGRGPYEDEVIFTETAQETGGYRQLYNAHGHPRNPETKRREREHVRAANEVMQVTGVVEDAMISRMKARAYQLNKNKETFTGIRLMDTGRTVLICGVWGVLGLRRRVLLSGIPTVLAYHLSDHLELLVQEIVDSYWADEKQGSAKSSYTTKYLTQKVIAFVFGYITLHFRMFAMLQQLNLIPGSRLLPGVRSFIPFSRSSPLQLPPSPSLDTASLASWGYALLCSAAPLLVIFAHGRLRSEISGFLYPHIFRSLPRPTGDSMFAGMQAIAPQPELHVPNRTEPLPGTGLPSRIEDEPTLRALEGFPTANPPSGPARGDRERDQASSDDEEVEFTQAALISFDIEATEALENSQGAGSWSAELRSANESRSLEEVEYYVTGLTILPPVLAAEGLREVVSGVLVLPLEAFMVRILGGAYRASAGARVADFYPVRFGNLALGNLISALAMQLALTGLTWGVYTSVIHLWASRRRAQLRDALVKAEVELQAAYISA